MNIRTAVFAGFLVGCGASSPPPPAVEPVAVHNLAPPQVEEDDSVRCVDFAMDTTAPMTLVAPLNVAEAPLNAFRSESGLATCVISPSSSDERPLSAEDRVTVHYSCWTTDGERFDSSVERGSPATFPLNGVIEGWTEGLQLMRVGERRRLWIPETLAYQGRSGRPAGVLVFDIELQEVVHAPEPPTVPVDVAAPPAAATSTSTGLFSRVLQAGQGSTHPTPTSQVTVHYTGWTTDGEMFDSSVTRGNPATFPLNRVIAGWTEGVQLMVEGEHRRFWIPAALAYQGRPGPQGMLVFDVELISIQP